MTEPAIDPDVGARLAKARAWLSHEHSLFRSLNLKPITIKKGKAVFSMDLPDTFADAHGGVHGGLKTIILDSIFGLTVFTTLSELAPIATINLHTDYLNKAKPGMRAICAAECTAQRDDVTYVSGDLKLEETGALLATGAGVFMVGTHGLANGSVS